MPSFFFNDPATTEIYPLSLHDALPIFPEVVEGQRPKRSRLDVRVVQGPLEDVPGFLRAPEVAVEEVEPHFLGVPPVAVGNEGNRSQFSHKATRLLPSCKEIDYY